MSATAPRPAPSSAPSARALRRNLAFDVVVAMGYGLTVTVALSLIPTIARQAGLDPIGLAVMAAAPFVGNLLSAFAGRIGPQDVRGFAVLRVVSALLLLAVAFAPSAGLIVIAVGLFHLFLSFGTPFQTRLWGAMYPTRVRARALGVLGTARYAAAGIAAVAVGALADRFGVPLAVSLAGLVGAGFAAAAFALRSGQPLPTRRYSPREAVTTLTTRPETASAARCPAFVRSTRTGSGIRRRFRATCLADSGCLPRRRRMTPVRDAQFLQMLMKLAAVIGPVGIDHQFVALGQARCLPDLLHVGQGDSQDSNQLRKAKGQFADPSRQLEAMAYAYWRFAFENKEYYQLMYGLGLPTCETAAKIPEIGAIGDLIIPSVRALIELNGNKDADAHLKFQTFWSLLHGLVSINMMGNKTDREELNMMVLKDFLQGFLSGFKT